MEQNGHYQNPENGTEDKYRQRKAAQLKGAKTKARNQRLVLYGAVSLLLFTFSGISFFVSHLALLSILLLLVGVIFVALSVRLELVGHGAIRGSQRHCANGLAGLGTINPFHFGFR
jgi:fatty acid desaturase